ncbi:MAG TPA: D-alanyl-D-alanine carboxypeptidase, partial [Pyrinomonadaceae bacterium]|nr:D-alanyl-D-alanine carboxypeptidase [Pyrinomonadaceae bacterium]
MAHKKHQRPRALTNAAAICAALFLVITFVASRTFQYSNAQAVAPARVGEAGVEGRRESAGQAARPGSVANSSSAIELGRKIDRLIDEGEFKDARWGVQVTRLRDGRVLYARNADKTFAPASNLKLYTTAVALDLLGADYTWRTSVYADAEPDRRGVVAGDLILYGRGAPDLSSFAERDETKSSLDRLADDLYARGLRRVRGNVVGDESYFRGDPLGDGWLWNDVQWYFGAEVSALSINDNEVSVYVTPAAKPGEAAGVRLKPETTYAHVLNDTNTAERSQPAT